MKIEVKTCYTGGMSLLITSGGYNKPIINKKTYSHDFQDENLRMKIRNKNQILKHKNNQKNIKIRSKAKGKKQVENIFNRFRLKPS